MAQAEGQTAQPAPPSEQPAPSGSDCNDCGDYNVLKSRCVLEYTLQRWGITEIDNSVRAIGHKRQVSESMPAIHSWL